MASDRAREIVAEINDAIMDSAGLYGSFGFALASDGLAQIREDLMQDIADAEQATLELHLDGSPVADNSIRIDALSRFLLSLQECVSSVGQALFGKITTRAAIPGPLRDATSLRLSSTFPGSFGAILKAPLRVDDQAEIPGLEGAGDLLDQSLRSILGLIDLAGRDDPNDEPIVDAVLPLGARTFKHLSDVSRVVADTGMSVSMKWHYPNAEIRQAIFSKPVAARLGDALLRNLASEALEVIDGRLGTVSDIRNRIELETSGGVVSASVIEELVPRLAEFYTHRVSATFEVTIVRSLVSGLERKSYRLVELRPSLDEETGNEQHA
ncbi:hypothetical protein [Actinoplanes sp. ATCC 53533]|uniref:hypothetical protein n=1 Tax=Actinoplanes sp. ATCC 53533 TaxID=1288362 RepID=UPI000F7B13A3|nr:hypothetical protein [Actinoplanes sp. ATCC 53533]